MIQLNLQYENVSLHFEEMWQSLLSIKNMRIKSCDSDEESVKASGIALSMCSFTIGNAISAIRDCDFNEEMVVILPDFSHKNVLKLLDYVQGKTVVFEVLSDKTEFEKLLETLSFGNDEEIEVDVKEEPMEPDLKDEEDVKCKPKKGRRCRKKNGEMKVKKESSGKRKRWFLDGSPMVKDEEKVTVACEGCDVNVSRLEDTLKHIEELAKNWNHNFNFELSRIIRNDRFRCPICEESRFEKKSQARDHVLFHIQEIHNDVKVCGSCPRNTEYPDV